MIERFASLSRLLSDVILPNLRAVQKCQAEQIADNDRLALAIEDLRTHLDSQFALLTLQLTSCQAELAATQAALNAAQVQAAMRLPLRKQQVH